MSIAATAAMATVLAFAAAGPALARALPPALAVRLLCPALIVVAGSGVFVLIVVMFLWLGQFGEIAEHGPWSAVELAVLDPISRPVSIGAGLLLVPASASALRTAFRQVRQVWECYRAECALPGRLRDPVTVLDSASVDAFTLPSGRIIVTSGLLTALSPEQQAILIAHERSHRTHRHAWWNLAADFAASVNPLLFPTARALRDATERWADEEAATTVDRRTVAATIAHVALLRTAAGRQTAGPAATGGRVPQRVQALLGPPPRTRAAHLCVVAALLAAVLVTTAAVQESAEDLFENAMRPHPTVPPAVLLHPTPMVRPAPSGLGAAVPSRRIRRSRAPIFNYKLCRSRFYYKYL